MHNQPDTLGIVIKSAREKAGITVEALSEKIGITERYLYRIENEGKKPRYDVLYKLIRELSPLTQTKYSIPKNRQRTRRSVTCSVCSPPVTAALCRSSKQQSEHLLTLSR